MSAVAAYVIAALVETLGDASAGHTAERLLILDGRRYIGKIWRMPGEQRHEQNLTRISPVLILGADIPLGEKSYSGNFILSSNFCSESAFNPPPPQAKQAD